MVHRPRDPISFRDLLRDLQWDLARYHHKLHQPKLAIVLLFPGFQADDALYRISRWLIHAKNSSISGGGPL